VPILYLVHLYVIKFVIDSLQVVITPVYQLELATKKILLKMSLNLNTCSLT